MTETPQNIAERGERIYQERYKTEYEAKHLGRFVAIDIESEEAFLADTPEGALNQARSTKPEGKFHLIRVGSPGVYKLGYSKGGNHGSHGNRLFG